MRITVVSIHPLYDGRIAKHLRLLQEAGCQVTYLNQSLSDAERQGAGLSRVRLIRRRRSASFAGSLFRYAGCLLWFAVRMLLSRPRVVHIHDLLLLPLVVPARCLPGCRVVFDIHEYYLRMDGRIGRLARLYYRWLIPLVHGLVGVSEDVFPPAACPRVVVPNYQDRRDYFAAPRPADELLPPRCSGETGRPVRNRTEVRGKTERAGGEEPLSSRRPIRLVYFGSLATEDRDVDLLLAVAEGLLRRTALVRWIVGGPLRGEGSGTFRNRLEQLQRDFPRRFEWRGVMSRSEVLRETSAADLGVLFHKAESRNYRGASPNKIFEYLAVGAGIVATDGFAQADEIAAAGAGLLFPPGVSAETVLARLQPLLDEPARLGRMKAASWQLGRRYDWSTVAERYLELYRAMGLALPAAAAQRTAGQSSSRPRQRAA